MTVTVQPATATEIVAIVGPLEDCVITRILATGATAGQVLEAYTWVNADDQIGTELLRSKRGTVGEVYEILMSEEPDFDDER